MGRILVNDLRVRTHVGVTEAERAQLQEVRVDLALDADLEAAAHSDKLEHAIDYADVTERVRRHVADNSFHLIERLAGSAAEIVLREYGRVDAVTVRATKFGCVPSTESVTVEVTQTR